MNADAIATRIDSSFPHNWRAEILSSRPAILPARHFVYPREAEEIEGGALEVLVRPGTPGAQTFLATCALGFRDPAAPTGVWSTPNPDEICAVAGGYVYLIDITSPERFTMLPYRPVLEIRSLTGLGLILFTGHRNILAWGARGEAWQSGKLSDEGITITAVDGDVLKGLGWNLLTDRETPFEMDLKTGWLI